MSSYASFSVRATVRARRRAAEIRIASGVAGSF